MYERTYSSGCGCGLNFGPTVNHNYDVVFIYIQGLVVVK